MRVLFLFLNFVLSGRNTNYVNKLVDAGRSGGGRVNNIYLGKYFSEAPVLLLISIYYFYFLQKYGYSNSFLIGVSVVLQMAGTTSNSVFSHIVASG